MENYKEMWKMMANYSFELESQQMRLFSCVICDSLLIDAYEGRCGSTYCKKCVDKFINEGGELCPCGSDECWPGSIELGRFPKKSHSSDRIISEMIVKCPSNACEYKYALIKMSDHLRICDNLIGCPFIEAGCDQIKMERSKVSDHLLMEIFDHSSMMIEWMKNMKNDVIDLMRSIISDITRNEIDKSIKTIVDVSVEHNRSVNEEHFIELRQEMISAKDKMDRLNLMIKESQEIFDREINLLKAENETLTENCQDLIEENVILTDKINELQKSLKIANKYFRETCDELRDEKDKEIGQLLDKIKLLTTQNVKPQIKRTSRSLLEKFFSNQSDCTPNLSSISDALIKPVSILDAPIKPVKILEEPSKFLSILKASAQHLLTSDESDKAVGFSDETIKPFASFQWIANNISHNQKYSAGQNKYYSYDNQYEIRFQIFNFGCQSDHRNTHICIRFRIVDGNAKIKSTRWPLTCMITVSIKSVLNKPKNIISLDKRVIFQQPNIDDLLKLSSQFHFNKSELNAKNIINNDSILMEIDMQIYQNK